MKNQRAIRYQGTVTSWKDDQGFGFIAPNGGGASVFVHVKSFESRATRPAAGAIVTYELSTNPQGQPRAENVAYVRARGAPQASGGRSSRALLIAVAFFGLMAASVAANKLPLAVFGAYLGMSAVAFAAYALDKSAARNNTWRTSEFTLHLLGLLGGWPGALVAQQILRHKSKKTAFRQVFWMTVVINCCALGWGAAHAAAT